MNLLAFFHECRSLICYATHYLFNDRYTVVSSVAAYTRDHILAFFKCLWTELRFKFWTTSRFMVCTRSNSDWYSDLGNSKMAITEIVITLVTVLLLKCFRPCTAFPGKEWHHSNTPHQENWQQSYCSCMWCNHSKQNRRTERGRHWHGSWIIWN